MPESNQSPSAPGFLQGSLQSFRDIGLGPVRRLKRIYTSEASDLRVTATAAVTVGLAVLCPLPFAVAGALAVIDDALNPGASKKEIEDAVAAQFQKKAERDALAAAVAGAPAAG